jgi:hypothetical protein
MMKDQRFLKSLMEFDKDSLGDKQAMRHIRMCKYARTSARAQAHTRARARAHYYIIKKTGSLRRR